jgi:acylphosphatase
MKANTIKVSGKVQGVYFRASAKQKAIMLGLCGFIQNKPDGSVYLEIEGETDAVQKMVTWCHDGPGLARVNHIDVQDQTARNFVSFDIKK